MGHKQHAIHLPWRRRVICYAAFMLMVIGMAIAGWNGYWYIVGWKAAKQDNAHSPTRHASELEAKTRSQAAYSPESQKSLLLGHLAPISVNCPFRSSGWRFQCMKGSVNKNCAVASAIIRQALGRVATGMSCCPATATPYSAALEKSTSAMRSSSGQMSRSFIIVSSTSALLMTTTEPFWSTRRGQR